MDIMLLVVFVSSFALGLLIHVSVWRIKKPADDAAALFGLTVVLPVFASALLAFFALDFRGLQMLDAALLGIIFHVGTGFAYMSLYTASQAASPTSLILLRAGRAGAHGMDETELCEQFTWQQLSGGSVQSAIEEGFLAVAADGSLQVATRGQALLRVCSTLRRFLNLPPGRG